MPTNIHSISSHLRSLAKTATSNYVECDQVRIALVVRMSMITLRRKFLTEITKADLTSATENERSQLDRTN